MTSGILSLVSVLFFANSASALDASRCPQRFDMSAEVVRVYKSSIYSKTPGWKEAQATLAATAEVKAGFYLADAAPAECLYESEQGHRAKLSTVRFQDPEEREPSFVEQLRIDLRIAGSSYVSYLPIKSYSGKNIEAHSRPFELKVKTRLYYPQTKRWVNLDMGMVSVTLN